MRLAFSTLACPNWSLEQAVAAVPRYGYEGLEIRLLDSELLPPDLDQASRQRVRSVCAAAGVPIICVDTSVKIAQTDPAARAEQIRIGSAMLELAAGWDAPMIRVFGGPTAGLSEDAAIAAGIECLAPLAERGRELGVAVVLETHDAFATSVPVAAIMREVPGKGAGVLWDIMNPYRMGETPDEVLERIWGRLLHVHIKDGRRPPEPDRDWDQTLLGEGDVPVPAILKTLQDRGYAGWLAVEWEKKWHPELADPEVALPQHAQVLRQWLGR